MSDSSPLMKDGLDKRAVAHISKHIKAAWSPFSESAFRRRANRGLERLELKQRVDHIIAALVHTLPDDYARVDAIYRKVADSWESLPQGDLLAEFSAWPVIDSVPVLGLEMPELALETLGRLTRHFSAEFAVRPFIETHESLTLSVFERWTTHEDPEVRRLVSEGCRPLLPWGKQLRRFKEDPAPILPLLDALKDDPSETVRRSVANNLNDISKHHPDLVISVCSGWLKDASDERRWIVRHATRTLVKAAHPGVWGLLGYTRNPKVEVSNLSVHPQSIRLGDHVVIAFDLTSRGRRSQNLVVDYAVHH